MKVLAAALLVSAVTTTSLDAQWLTLPTPGIPRTAEGKPNLAAAAPSAHDGHPDFTGLWNLSAQKGDLLEGASAAQPGLQGLIRERAENFYKDSPAFSCLPLGPMYIASRERGMKRILQTPAVIAILNDDLTYREIFIDGRQLEAEPNPTWMGYSVGRWEGDALIVESAGFNDRTWLNNPGLSHSEALRITERYRRPDFGHLQIEATYSDPAAYTRPLHLTVTLTLAADTELLEAVCESPHLQQHWVGTASDAAKSSVKVAPEVLTKYAGVYKGLWGRTPRTVRVSVINGALVAQFDERGSPQPLAAQSETLFVGQGGLGYQFLRNEQGTASAVIEHHVSGSYTYPRQP